MTIYLIIQSQASEDTDVNIVKAFIDKEKAELYCKENNPRRLSSFYKDYWYDIQEIELE